MIRAVRFLPESQDDVDDIVRYFDHRSESESVGDRFFAAVHKTVEMLRHHPEMGTVLRSALGKTTRLRTIIDFKKYLIFYFLSCGKRYAVDCPRAARKPRLCQPFLNPYYINLCPNPTKPS